MKKVLISVEGQTEEKFVSGLLRTHLSGFGIFPQPVIVSTKYAKQGDKFKGGLISYAQARDEVRRLLLDTSAVAVTSMYDYYQLPGSFPGYTNQPAGNGKARARFLEYAFEQDVNQHRFHAYLQVHEFEALLFTLPEVTALQFPQASHLAELRSIRQEFPTPEDINDDPRTAPSKRLLTLYPRYRKTIDGLQAAQNIGLQAMRAECEHFGEWLGWLESLA
jgi:hypothetical protein